MREVFGVLVLLLSGCNLFAGTPSVPVDASRGDMPADAGATTDTGTDVPGPDAAGLTDLADDAMTDLASVDVGRDLAIPRACLQEQLLLHWDFADLQDNVVPDRSGNGHQGEVFGNPGISTNSGRTTLVFDGG
ncbi:MAG: hypothetical protein R3324_13900, partial [Halobacteriales archaeon]|nr:hypothetical protein [Halobacteriales archaeon]